MKLSELFETQECSRCGGTGRYSWCQKYGDRCFKCAGSGRQFSKRGEAARSWYVQRLSVPVTELKPGDRVWDESVMGSAWRTVKSVSVNDDGTANVVFMNGHELMRWTGSMRKSWTESELQPLRDQALTLQAEYLS